MGSEWYSLKEIAKRLGVPQRVVVQWEEAYPEWIVCRKSESGEKSYGRDALTALERVKNLVYRCGYGPDDVTAALRKSDLPRYDPMAETDAGPAPAFDGVWDSDSAATPRAPGVPEPSVLTSRYATSPYSSVAALVQQNAAASFPLPPERAPFRTKPAEPFTLPPKPPVFTELAASSPGAELRAEPKEPQARGKPSVIPTARKAETTETPTPASKEASVLAAVRAAALEAAAIREELSRLLPGSAA